MKIKSRDGVAITDEWLCSKAVELLEKAMEADPVDHAACKGYLDLVARILLPKVGVERDPEGDKRRRKLVERAT